MTETTPSAITQKQTQQLAELLKAKITEENPASGPMRRDAHPKQHGFVKATFTVEQDLPSNLAIGVFQPGKSYDCWVRYSNQNAPIKKDWSSDIRGMAIKLLNVPGEKLLPCRESAPSHDFILISTPKFVTKNLNQFLGLIRGLVGNPLKLGLHILLHPRIGLNLLQSNKRFADPSKVRYWSTTTYKFGKDIVKYSAIPHQYNTESPKKTDSDDFMRENLKKRLGKEPAKYDFCVQFFKEGFSLTDFGKEWKEKDSEFIKLATIEIPIQEFDSIEQRLYGRKMSYNPWMALEEHRPIGDINEARKVIYKLIADYRHEKNNVQYSEPTDLSVPGIEEFEEGTSKTSDLQKVAEPEKTEQ